MDAAEVLESRVDLPLADEERVEAS